jgi:hypothetical protein
MFMVLSLKERLFGAIGGAAPAMRSSAGRGQPVAGSERDGVEAGRLRPASR